MLVSWFLQFLLQSVSFGERSLIPCPPPHHAPAPYPFSSPWVREPRTQPAKWEVMEDSKFQGSLGVKLPNAPSTTLPQRPPASASPGLCALPPAPACPCASPGPALGALGLTRSLTHSPALWVLLSLLRHQFLALSGLLSLACRRRTVLPIIRKTWLCSSHFPPPLPSLGFLPFAATLLTGGLAASLPVALLSLPSPRLASSAPAGAGDPHPSDRLSRLFSVLCPRHP